MLHLDRIGIVDLVISGFIVIAVVGALRSRRGVLGVLGSIVGTVALTWLLTVALTTWGPRPVAAAIDQSAFARTFPAPTKALGDLGLLRDGPVRGGAAGPPRPSGPPG